MGYDRDDSFPFDFKPNGSPFGSKSKGKRSPRTHPYEFGRKYKSTFLNVKRLTQRPANCTIYMLTCSKET